MNNNLLKNTEIRSLRLLLPRHRRHNWIHCNTQLPGRWCRHMIVPKRQGAKCLTIMSPHQLQTTGHTNSKFSRQRENPYPKISLRPITSKWLFRPKLQYSQPTSQHPSQANFRSKCHAWFLKSKLQSNQELITLLESSQLRKAAIRQVWPRISGIKYQTCKGNSDNSKGKSNRHSEIKKTLKPDSLNPRFGKKETNHLLITTLRCSLCSETRRTRRAVLSVKLTCSKCSSNAKKATKSA